VTPLRLDVTEPEEVRHAAARIARDGRGLYGLVNNAGICDFWPVVESEVEDFQRMFEVNVWGVHRVARAMLPMLVESRGRIVNISSISGIRTSKVLGAYQMSKHALEAYSEVLALELEPCGVSVSIVEPGNFRSDISKTTAVLVRKRAETFTPLLLKDEAEAILRGLDKDIEDTEKELPPDEVAEAVFAALFSARPRVRYVVTPNEEEFLRPVTALLMRLVQVNESSRYGLTRDQLQAMMDTFLGRRMTA